MNSPVRLAIVDKKTNRNIYERCMIDMKEMYGSETVFVIEDIVINYNYGKYVDNIIQFVKNNTPQLLLTDKDIKTFKKSSSTTMIAAFNHNNEIERIYLSIYLFFRKNRRMYESHRISFGYILNESIAKSNGILFPGLVMYTNFEPFSFIYEGDLKNKSSIKSFIFNNEFPNIIDMYDQIVLYNDDDIRINQYVLLTDEGYKNETIKDTFSAIAKEFRGIFFFVCGKDYQHYFDIKESSYPEMYIIEKDINKKYKYTEKDFTVDKMKKFIQMYFEGKLSILLKSEPIPEKQEDVVYKIVGNTFNATVLTEGIDVFVRFFAPWSCHCEALKPKYKKLAEKLAGNEKLIIGEIDGTVNEIYYPEIKISGFPTLVLITADNKVVNYEGERSLYAMIDFLKNNAINPIKINGDREI